MRYGNVAPLYRPGYSAMRRMEDKIRKLCGQIAGTKDDDEVRPILIELRDALHEHIESLRARLADYPIVIERRDRNGVPIPDRNGFPSLDVAEP